MEVMLIVLMVYDAMHLMNELEEYEERFWLISRYIIICMHSMSS